MTLSKHIPVGITVESYDVGATQMAVFYLNGKPMVAFLTGTRHPDSSVEYATDEFNAFLSESFAEFLENSGYRNKVTRIPVNADASDFIYDSEGY